MTPRRPSRRACLWALLGAPLAGCATWVPPMSAALLRSPPAGLPRRMLLPGVPHFPDSGSLCGPATLASALGATGVAVDLPTLSAQVYLPGRQGSLQVEMLAAARRQGRLAMLLPPSQEGLFSELAAGNPAVLLLNLGLSWIERWHYVVLVGYDLETQEVILHSGEQAQVRWPLQTLEFTWARSGHWAMVVTGTDRLPANATPERLLPALLGLDRSLPPGQPTPLWALAHGRWPQDLNLALGWGNSLLAAGELPAAAAAFEAAAHDHDSTVAWNNLAQVRWQLGQRDAARDAARHAWLRAQAAEPAWRDAVRGTLVELGLPTD